MVVIVALFLSSTIVVLVDMTRGILQSPAVKMRGLPLSKAVLHGTDYTMQVCTRFNVREQSGYMGDQSHPFVSCS